MCYMNTESIQLISVFHHDANASLTENVGFAVLYTSTIGKDGKLN